MESAHSLTAVGLFALTILLFVSVAVGFALRGPARWVKTCAAALVICFFVCEYLLLGPRAVLLSVGITGGTTIAAIALALNGWRYPVDQDLAEVSEAACPGFARSRIAGWTDEFSALGYSKVADREGIWRMHGSEKRCFTRFLAHHSEPTWVELHALSSPKVAARILASAKGEEGAVLTVDQQSDQELLGDPLVAVQRLPRSSSCRSMADAHRPLAARTQGEFRAASDPVGAHRWVFFRWSQRLIDSGAVERDGEMIRVRPSQFPRLMLRMFAAWFH